MFLEVDQAMILLASTEKDKMLKKRNTMFYYDGTLAELKRGIEIDREFTK
jgi:hypothetical protein